METKDFKIEGMHCASCVLVVERAIKKQKGVSSVLVNLATETATVSYDPNVFNERIMAKVIKEKGYKLAAGKEQKDSSVYFVKFLASLIFALPVFVLSMFVPHSAVPNMNFILLMLAFPVQFILGYEFYKKAFMAAKSLSATMETLVALGTSAAFFYSVYLMAKDQSSHLYFETSTVLITVIFFGRYLEAKAKLKGADAVKKLMQLFPKKALVVRAGEEKEINADEIIKGDIVILKPGSRSPSDGIVETGSGDMDERAVTGEPMPVSKHEGDTVISGSVLINGSIRLRAIRVGSESTLNGIIAMISRARAGKTSSQKLADKVSFYFVPSVIAAAALTFIIRIFGGSGFERALISSVSVLVVACPCALGLATPAAVIAGSSRALRHGIIVKDVQALESAAKATDIVFDKTGTLTTGKPALTAIKVKEFFGENKILEMLASLSFMSKHPVAEEILKYTEGKGAKKLEVKGFTEIPGTGIKGIIDGCEVIIGNYDALYKMGFDMSLFEKNVSSSCMFVDNKPAAEVIFTDNLRPDAEYAVKKIVKSGIKPHLVTGDSEISALNAANKCGIDIKNVIFRASPADKQNYVIMLKNSGSRVIFAGDGINDAAALAAADCGAAFAGGTDIASEAGNCLIMRNDVDALNELVITGKLTVKKIRQNLFWAFFYNVTAIPFAAAGFLNPMIAGTAMALSSVSVLLNSLAMKK